MMVDITFLGDNPLTGIEWQAQPQTLNQAFGTSQADARAKFVEAWNEQTGDAKTEADFQWQQQGGPPEESPGE